MSADSKESKRLKAKTPALRLQLIPYLQSVASEMNAKSILPDNDLLAIQNVQPGSEGRMVDKMIAALKVRVKAKSKHYYTFLDILQALGEEDLEDIISELKFGMSQTIVMNFNIIIASVTA